MTEDGQLSARLDRIESYLQIQQLVARYAWYLDGRDIDGLVGLYVDDVKVGAPVGGVGHDALRDWFIRSVHYWYRSLHHIGGHVIEFNDSDHATGVVQCRVEQEIGDRWHTTAVLYNDHYERRNGSWRFAHRHGQPAWCYAYGDDPVATGFDRLPGGMPIRLPHEFPKFAEFWEQFSDEDIARVTRKPLGRAENRSRRVPPGARPSTKEQ
jgi:ketosteroid isomerase-like protein